MDTDQLTTQVADQLGAQQRLLVAFSGGLDSSVLLHLLAALRRQRPALQLRAARAPWPERLCRPLG